jgi:hypothetical protein
MPSVPVGLFDHVSIGARRACLLNYRGWEYELTLGQDIKRAALVFFLRGLPASLCRDIRGRTLPLVDSEHEYYSSSAAGTNLRV